MKHRQVVWCIGSLVVAVGLVLWYRHPTAADRAGWLADYELLRSGTTAAYANLADRLRSRRINPAELDAKTRERLMQSRNVDEARAALQSFVAAFDDHHFRARAPAGMWQRWKQRRQDAAHSLPAGLSGIEACARLGYSQRDRGQLDWAALPGWQPLGGGTALRPFLAGILASGAAAESLAVLRIQGFMGESFPALCTAQWEEFRRTLSTTCDADCVERFALRIEFSLLERLAAQLQELRHAGAGLLLVDVTGNGGGTSLVDPMARELTNRPLREPELGFIRHAHWEKQFAVAREEFARDLQRADLTPAQRDLLQRAQAQAEAMHSEAAHRCSLSHLWSQSTPELPCQPVGRFSGYLRYAKPGSLDGLSSNSALFGPSQYRYVEGAWSGPLVVLIDRWTASAAEEFAALLKDNGAATLVGEGTMGIGCGYTNGGVALNLPHTGLTVRMPDCIRYRADGHSEAEGIAPDRPVTWLPDDNGATRAAKALAAVRLAPTVAPSPDGT